MAVTDPRPGLLSFPSEMEEMRKDRIVTSDEDSGMSSFRIPGKEEALVHKNRDPIATEDEESAISSFHISKKEEPKTDDTNLTRKNAPVSTSDDDSGISSVHISSKEESPVLQKKDDTSLNLQKSPILTSDEESGISSFRIPNREESPILQKKDNPNDLHKSPILTSDDDSGISSFHISSKEESPVLPKKDDTNLNPQKSHDLTSDDESGLSSLHLPQGHESPPPPLHKPIETDEDSSAISSVKIPEDSVLRNYCGYGETDEDENCCSGNTSCPIPNTPPGCFNRPRDTDDESSVSSVPHETETIQYQIEDESPLDSEEDYESDDDPFPILRRCDPAPQEPPHEPPKMDAEARLQVRLREAREKYIQMVNDAIKELGIERYQVDAPPAFELMSDREMEEELAGFGFRFVNRAKAIDKLTRCWAAKRNGNTTTAILTPAEFIRQRSQFYEQILTYQPIPLAALLHELTENGIKISIHGLRKLLDDEGVAFLDDDAARR